MRTVIRLHNPVLISVGTGPSGAMEFLGLLRNCSVCPGTLSDEGIAMDDRTGRIHSAEEIAGMSEADRLRMKLMELAPTDAQLASGRVRRDDPCPCGSGRTFGRCCYNPVPGSK